MNFPMVYAVKHKNFDIRMASRSGGIFTALSDAILRRNGVVYGCVQTDDFMAAHVRAGNADGRDKMRGSKYIQSSMGDVFQQVRNDLKRGRQVLFSGTSCQVSGLKSFLGESYDNLICVDIVCRGVPSPLVWQEYLNYQSARNGECVSVDFRNKVDFGWKAHIETMIFKTSDGSSKKVSSPAYKTLFHEKKILRPCCYKCPYKDVIHPGDITIADYWGIEKAAPDFSDNRGVSLVLINNDRGGELFDSVSGDVEMRSCRIEDSMQPALVEPWKMPHDREKFWCDFYTKSFELIVKKYGGEDFKAKVKRGFRKVGRMLKRK
ncbi:MAG: Coenzyme F420 hydrogenase/dehydrogenase, beta subunit C-terminal domain [Ruminococcus sp.]|nr:Coenzyme F420 hydrogenase/dehydrogenase, beta subunit C-terminal domain [Ruminococcus sp.]